MSNKSKFYIFMFLMMSCFALTACSSDKPVSSGSANGDGYTITLASTSKELESGGSIILTATVFDPSGNLVASEDSAVYFSCNVADVEFDDEACDIKSGVATTLLHWADDSDKESPEPSKIGIVSASYMGAIAQLNILLIAENF